MKEHVIIAGTGRTGTTFLVELLTNLGLETGFNSESIVSKKSKVARAGLEHNFRFENCPYIVKDPNFFEYAKETFLRKDVVVKHIFIPIRDLHAAAESRRIVTKATIRNRGFLGRIKFLFKRGKYVGGLSNTFTFKKGAQEFILLNQFYKLMLDTASTQTQVTLIEFPKSIKDDVYLYEKLKPILKDISFDFFAEKFKQTIQPEIVHNFN